MTEQQLVEYILTRVNTLYPKFTHEQKLAYALGFMASQICVSIEHDNKYMYRIKDALNNIGE